MAVRMKYDVTVYPVAMVRVKGVEAGSHVEAIKAAEDIIEIEVPGGLNALLDRKLSGAHVAYVEAAGEIVGYLVDEQGDEGYLNTRYYDDDLVQSKLESSKERFEEVKAIAGALASALRRFVDASHADHGFDKSGCAPGVVAIGSYDEARMALIAASLAGIKTHNGVDPNDGLDDDPPGQLARYLSTKGVRCLICGQETDITGESVDIDEGGAFQEVSCSVCGASWTDEYALVGVRNIATGSQG